MHTPVQDHATALFGLLAPVSGDTSRSMDPLLDVC